jgi:hypothetical protein
MSDEERAALADRAKRDLLDRLEEMERILLKEFRESTARIEAFANSNRERKV